MSKSVEERVVRMEFDNKQFEQNVAQSLKTLERLEKSVDGIDKRGASFSGLADSIKGIDFNSIERGIKNVSNRFTLWGRFVDDVRGRMSSLMIEVAKFPLHVYDLAKTGGINRALNIENAKFQLKGLGVMWSEIEEDINYGVKDTAYGLDAAAKAASQLVASNVHIGDEMKASLRGISGVAAMTNSSYEDIARVFTTVAGNGRLMGDQLNQIAARGLNVAATLAKALGTTEGEVRSMVSKGQIDFQTFANAMDDAFGDHAKDANKTFTGAMSNVKAALSRTGQAFAASGMQRLRYLFVDLIPLINQFNKALAPVSTDVMNMFSSIVNKVRGFIYTYKNDIVDTLINFGKTFVNIAKLVSKYGKVLFSVVKDVFGLDFKNFRGFSDALEDMTSRMNRGTTYATVFRKTLTNILNVVKDIIGFIKDVIYVLSPVTKIIKSVGKLVLTTINAISKSFHKVVGGKNGPTEFIERLHDDIDGIATFIASLIDRVTERVDGIVSWITDKIIALKEFFSTVWNSAFGAGIIKVIDSLKRSFGGFGTFITDSAIPTAFDLIAAALDGFGQILLAIDWDTVFQTMKDGFSWIKDGIDAITNTLSGGRFETFGSIFSSITGSVNEFSGAINTTADSVERISGSVGEATESVDGLFAKFDDRGIAGSITGTADALAEFTDSSEGAGQGVSALVGKLKDIPGTVGTTATNTLTDIAEKGKNLFDSLYTAIGSPDPGSIMGLAFGFAGAKGLLTFSDFLKDIGSAAKNFSAPFGAVGKSLKAIGTGIGSLIKNTGKSSLMKSFAVMLGVLTASIIALAIASTKYDIEEAVLVVAGLCAGLVFAIEHLMAATKMTDASKIRSIAVIAVAIGATALLMAFAAKQIASIPWDEMSNKSLIASAIVFAGIIGALIAIAKLISGVGSFSIGDIKTGDKKGGGSGFWGLIGITIAVVAILAMVKSMEDEDVSHLQAVIAPIGILILTLGVIGKLLSDNGFQIAGVGAGIFLMLGSIVSLVLAMAGLVLIIHNSKPWEWIVALGLISGAVTILTGIVVLMSQLKFDDSVLKIGASIAAIGGAILLLSIALNIAAMAFKGDKWKAAWQAVIAIGLIVAEFGALMVAVSRFGAHGAAPEKMALPILAIGGAIILIAASMMILSTLEPEKIRGTALAVIGVILAIGAAMFTASIYADQIKTAPIVGLLVGLGLLVAELVGVMVAINAFGEDTFYSALSGFVVVLMASIVGMYAASKLTDKINWKGLLTLAGAVAIISAALIATALLVGDPATIVASGIGLGVALLAVGGAMWGTAKLTDKINWKGLVMLAGTVAILAAAITIMSRLGDEADKILAAGIALGITLLVVTLLSKLAGDSLTGAGAVLIMSVAVIALAGAMMMLSTIPFKKLKDNLIATGIALAVLVGAILLLGLGPVAGVAMTGAIVLGIIALAAIGLAFALKIAVETVDSFADTLVNLGQRAPAMMHSIEALMKGIKAIVLDAIADIVEGIPVIGKEMAKGIRESADEAEAEMQKASLQATAEETAYQANQRMLEGLKGDPNKNKGAGLEMMGDFLSGVQDKIPDFNNLGSSMISGDNGLLGGLTGGFNDMMPDINSLGSELISGDNGLMGGLTGGFDQMMPNIEDMMGENGLAGALDVGDLASISGQNTFAGFDQALPDSLFSEKGLSNGNSYMEAFNKALGNASPSKKTRKSGKYVDEGFALGLKDGQSGIDKAVDHITSNTLSGFDASESFRRSGVATVEGLNKGLKDRRSINNAKKSTKQLGKTITKSFNEQMQIHSPSKVMEESGKNICRGIAEGILSGIPEMQEAMDWVGSVIQKRAYDMDVGDDVFLGILQNQKDFLISQVGVDKAVDAARTSVTAFVDSLYKGTDAYRQHLDTIEDYKKQIAELSKDTKKNSKELVDLFDKIKDEAKSMATEAKQGFNDLRNSMITAMTDMLKISNLSYDMTIAFSTGVSELIQNAVYSSIDALSDFANHTKKTLNSSLTPFKKFSEGLKNTVNSSLNVLQDFTDGTKESLNSALKALESFERKSKGSLVGSLDIFGSYEKNEKWESNGAFLDHIEKTLEEAEKKIANFDAVKAKGLSDEVILHIKEMGSEGDKLLEELASYDEEQIAKVNAAWSRQKELTAEQFEDPTEAIFRSMTEEIEKAQKRIDDFAKLEQTDIDKRFLEELREMGDEGKDIIDGILKMTPEQIQKFNEMYAQELSLSAPTKLSPFDAILKPMEENLQKAEERASKMAQLATLGIEKAYLKELMDMGDGADALIDQFIAMTDSEIAKFNELYKRQNNLKEGANISDPVAAMFDELDKSLAKAQERVDNFAKLKAMGIHDKYLAELRDMGDEAEDIITGMLQFSAEQVTQFNEKYAVVLNFKENEGGITAMLDTMDDAISKNLQKRTDIEALKARGVSSEIIKQIEAMGDEGTKILAEMVNAEEDRINEIIAKFKQIEELNKNVNEGAAKSGKEIVDIWNRNLNEDMKLQEKYAKLVTMGFSKEVIAEIKASGDDAGAMVDAFLAMKEDEVQYANKILSDRLRYESDLMEKHLDEAADTNKEFYELLTDLAKKGVNEGVITELAKMGPSSVEILKRLNGMTEPELKEWCSKYENYTKQAVSYTDDAIGQMATNALKAAGSFADGLALYNLGAHSPSIKDNYIGFLNGMGVQLNETAYKVGFDTVENLARSLEENASKAGGAAGGVKDAVTGGLGDEEFHRNNAEGLGKATLQGLIFGLNDAKLLGQLRHTSSEVAYLPSNKYRNVNTIKSPSRLFRQLGQYTVEGLILGLKDGIEDLDNTSVAMAETLYASMGEMQDILPEDAINLGLTLDQGIKEGIEKDRSKVVTVGLNLVINIHSTMLSFVRSCFPNIGTAMGDGIINGLLSKKNAIISVAVSVANAAYIAAKDSFSQIGYAITDGLVRGIYEGESNVLRAVKEVARRALEEAAEELDINSPSKEFAKLGYYSDAGFAKGLTDNASMVEDAAGDMAESALYSLQSVIQSINDSLDAELNDPVIRPTIDTSDIERAANMVNSMFNDSQAKLRSDISATGEAAQNQGSTVNFYQTNNSPKALSRTEIYRQTNNQLRQIRSALG